MAIRRWILSVVFLAVTMLAPTLQAIGASAYSATWTPADSGPWLMWGATAFEPTTGRLVVFGGTDRNTAVRRETRFFDPALDKWTTLSARRTDPAARALGRMVWDPALAKLVMFGGRDARGRSLQDTWTFDPVTKVWSALVSNCRKATCPPARWGHEMVWSSALGRILMFGGRSDLPSTATFADLWSFDGSSWARLSQASGPPARFLMGMAEDPGTGSVLVYGGATASVAGLSDTWIYDPPALKWTRVRTATLPEQRSDLGMAWLPSLDRIVISSGADASGCTGLTNSTWAFDANLGDWVQVTTAGGPPTPRNASRLITDTRRGSAILLGPPDWDVSPELSDYAWILK